MVNDGLNTMTQGLEEGGNSECRDHDGNIVPLVDDPSEQVLQDKDETNINQGQDRGQAAIDERAIDQHVDVVQSIPQNREPNGERDQKQSDGEDETPHFIPKNSAVEGWAEQADDE